jgi:hypothetical protein
MEFLLIDIISKNISQIIYKLNLLENRSCFTYKNLKGITVLGFEINLKLIMSLGLVTLVQSALNLLIHLNK